jgi:hypothetical protein
MMLGVRRPGVTLVAQSLQEHGLITYDHGTMTVLDRKGLEGMACECYGIISACPAAARDERTPVARQQLTERACARCPRAPLASD